ncbi:hypothetical protein H5410_008399 [Solanum commersonii]|uniref:CCHC-type domain-containing protein n=1 Tax=Solanum commersonii TaxID=4109 RepID=A0A9J6AEU8_SOLCO|nr:hypothetical protein H5410_008399 [Solanum commersonii]
METYSAIWIRPPELPTEFYDHSILAKVEVVYIGYHRQPIVYEGADIVCTGCGVLGHTIQNCISKQPPQEQPNKDKDREEDKSISQLSTGG